MKTFAMEKEDARGFAHAPDIASILVPFSLPPTCTGDGVAEVLREIVEEVLLPTHAETMSDEIGVEITSPVRSAKVPTDLGPFLNDGRCFRPDTAIRSVHRMDRFETVWYPPPQTYGRCGSGRRYNVHMCDSVSVCDRYRYRPLPTSIKGSMNGRLLRTMLLCSGWHRHPTF